MQAPLEHIIYQRTVLLDDTKYESLLCTSPLDLLSSKTSGTFEKQRVFAVGNGIAAQPLDPEQYPPNN